MEAHTSRQLTDSVHRERAEAPTGRPRGTRRGAIALLGIGLAAALAIGCGGDDGSTGDAGATTAQSTIPQPTQAQLAAAVLDKLPLAPEGERIDIEAPTFSNPTEITNPLFPINELHSVIFSGKVGGKPFHTETTLLPETRVIEWSEGQQVEARVSQYFAYIDGRIEEVALDYYAQADDGAVWYLGEDVFDYNEDGFIDSTGGTWLAGKEGPAEMIMPADPRTTSSTRPALATGSRQPPASKPRRAPGTPTVAARFRPGSRTR